MNAPTTDVDDLLLRGRMRLVGLLPRASNYTFLAEVADEGRTVRVVYKPRAGETPLWDYPEGTLCQREVAAHRLARALGWPNVPPTVLRDGPHGEGSVQLFVDADPGHHYLTLRHDHRDAFREIAAFDVVAGNGDRKSGHCLLDREGRIWTVDHGLCFAARPWLRTVIWEFAGEPVPPRLARDLERVAADIGRGSLRGELLGYLSQEEVDALAARAIGLAEEGTYPAPGPGRSRPWPPV